jgi:hypothetical protein
VIVTLPSATVGAVVTGDGQSAVAVTKLEPPPPPAEAPVDSAIGMPVPPAADMPPPPPK